MLISLEETKALIESKKVLHIAGNCELLEQLPAGNWIGGHSSYFITNHEGGIHDTNRLFVTELTHIKKIQIIEYDAQQIHRIGQDTFNNGYTLLILPFGSELANRYAEHAMEYKDLFMTPIIGWVTTSHLDEPEVYQKVFDGTVKQSFREKAVAMHIELEEGYGASLGTINIFEKDPESPIIHFEENTMLVDRCLIEGKSVKLSEYIEENHFDVNVPLQSNWSGSKVNTSMYTEKIDKEGYIPLSIAAFKGVDYYFSKPVPNYEEKFATRIKEYRDKQTGDKEIILSYNCLANYLRGALEGAKTTPFEGIFTGGEIGYILLNQTLTYLELYKH